MTDEEIQARRAKAQTWTHEAALSTVAEGDPAWGSPPFVSGSCRGELCHFVLGESRCDSLATRKVGEEIPSDYPEQLQMRHNLTAYVCEVHFQAIVGNPATLKAAQRLAEKQAEEKHGVRPVGVDANGSET